MAGGDDDEEARVVAALVAQVVALNDHDAFAGLVHRFQRPVRRFLIRLTGDAEAADDLAQNAFVKAYRHMATFEGRGRFASWLFRIAYQEFVTAARARRVIVAPLDVEPADARLDDRLVAKLTVDRAMTHLRPEERAALDLHYRQALTHAEIATVLDLPVGTVKSLILRGRDKLRAVVTGRGTPKETP